MTFRLSVLAISIGCIASGCITVTTVNIGQKTSLERQLIGELEPLSEDELLAASVRSDSTIGTGALADAQAKALAARRRQLFNRDDIDSLKDLGCIGETNAATLAIRDCSGSNEQQELAKRVLPEENEDRQSIIDFVVTNDAVLTPADTSKVRDVYTRLMHSLAKPGHWVQDDQGTWSQR